MGKVVPNMKISEFEVDLGLVSVDKSVESVDNSVLDFKCGKDVEENFCYKIYCFWHCSKFVDFAENEYI